MLKIHIFVITILISLLLVSVVNSIPVDEDPEDKKGREVFVRFSLWMYLHSIDTIYNFFFSLG